MATEGKDNALYQVGTLSFDDPIHQLKQNILHVDMDAFYASLAERDNPALRGKPVIMAQHPRVTKGTGIVATANYIARKFGVRSGMPAIEALRLCPNAVFVPVNHPYIQSVSEQLYRIYAQYTSVIQKVGYDEAYLSLSMAEDGEQVAHQIQAQIKKEVNLTCSIGVSYNKILAKMASDYQKPMGMTIIRPEQAVTFLKNMPVKDFHGIGPKTSAKLQDINVRWIGQLQDVSYETLDEIFGNSAQTVYERIWGLDPRPVVSDMAAKSSGTERTYHPFLQTNDEMKDAVTALVDKLGDTLAQEDHLGTTVVLKIRDGAFNNYSKRRSVKYLFNDKATLYDLAIECWMALRGRIAHPVRLVGITLVGLEKRENGGEGQCLLF